MEGLLLTILKKTVQTFLIAATMIGSICLVFSIIPNVDSVHTQDGRVSLLDKVAGNTLLQVVILVAELLLIYVIFMMEYGCFMEHYGNSGDIRIRNMGKQDLFFGYVKWAMVFYAEVLLGFYASWKIVMLYMGGLSESGKVLWLTSGYIRIGILFVLGIYTLVIHLHMKTHRSFIYGNSF